MNTIKITNAMRELCYLMMSDRDTHRSLDTWEHMEHAGLVVTDGNGWSLTEAGKLAGAEWRKKLDARNKAARGRNQAMRDLGMVKTPYGWE